MLAEGIIGEQDVVSGHEGRHGIRPVEHPHLNKDQLLAVADIHAVAGFHHMEVPSALSILSLDALNSICSAVDGCIRNLLHKSRKRT